MLKLRMSFYRYASLENNSRHTASLGPSIEAAFGNNVGDIKPSLHFKQIPNLHIRTLKI
jgi:hypothetical protein